MEQKSKSSNIWSKINDFISTYKGILLVSVPVFTALIGWIFFDISLGQPFKEIAFKQGEYERKETQEKYKQGMVNNHLMLGDRFLNVGQYKAAKIEFEKAIKLDAFCSEAEMGLFKADIYDTIATKGYDPEIIIERIKRIMEQDTAHFHAYVYMGDVYSYINEEKAHAYYDIAIKKDTTMASAYFGKGLIYSRHGNSKEGEVMYRKALDISPWNRVFMGNLAYQYYRNQKYTDAIRCCDSLDLLDSQYLVSHYTRASSYLCKGDLNNSIHYYQWLINLTNDNKVFAQEMNAGVWFFIEGKANNDTKAKANAVYFYNINEKKYYAFYSIALAYYLNEDYDLCTTYINLARSLQLNIYRQLNINSLINWDINNLAEVQPKYADACARFKAAVNL
ncbi:MAG: tetratricopeptide repeat protein [Bacteroidota bacterium]